MKAGSFFIPNMVLSSVSNRKAVDVYPFFFLV